MSNQQLINFSSEISNIPMEVEIIDLSDDQDIEKLKRQHIRKTININVESTINRLTSEKDLPIEDDPED
ncbi:11490_t:CDS:2 [Entrophospora sp. SA101]|nr:11490_t:CDS:2 [Entrophospora sp. SA101]